MVKFSFILAFVLLSAFIASAYAVCNGDPNASLQRCESLCPASCANRRPRPTCGQRCEGDIGYCVCNAGFVRNRANKCVQPSQC